MATSVEIQPWKRNICGVLQQNQGMALQQNQGMAKAIPCHTEPSAPGTIDTCVLVAKPVSG